MKGAGAARAGYYSKMSPNLGRPNGLPFFDAGESPNTGRRYT